MHSHLNIFGVYLSEFPLDPFVGMGVIQETTGKQLFWYGNSLGWLPDWSTEWGEVASVNWVPGTFTTGNSNLWEDIVGAYVVYTAILGRRYLAIYECQAQCAVGAGDCPISITDGLNNILNERMIKGGTTTSNKYMKVVARSAGNESGACVRKARIQQPSGGSSQPNAALSQLQVYDIGAAAPPVIT